MFTGAFAFLACLPLTVPPFTGGEWFAAETNKRMATKNQQEIFQPLTSAEVSVEPYIGKAEVARRMGRTVRAVEAMMRRRLIPFYKFDSRAVFRWSEIQAALAETCRVSALTISK